LTPETSASPAGLTARARPKARPYRHAANLHRYQHPPVSLCDADLLAALDLTLYQLPRRYYDPRMDSHHPLHLGIWLPIILIIAILFFAFEIWMIVDAAINKEITDRAKAWWIIGMFIIHPFVAIAYFFTDHRKR
jgi:hypothetical protein